MEANIRRKFGARIYALRTKKGWSQQELAERADIAVRHVQRLESKSPSPVKIDTMEKLSKAFGIPLKELLNL